MTDRIDAYCSLAHYAEHLTPILDALPAELRGHVYAPRPTSRQIDGCKEGSAPDSTMPLLVGGYQDLVYSRRPKVLVQHGAGQTYVDCESPSFAGGPSHQQANLFLVPNERVGRLERDRYPHAQVAVVGCPKLSRWAKIPKPANDPPVVAVTFHWNTCVKDTNGRMLPEAGWAFPTWRDTIEQFAKDFTVLGHAHPRAARELAPWWASIGVEFVPNAVELLGRADCLIGDNTSLLFEWAALDRPVVFLRGADWTDIRHGPPRFGGMPLPGPELGPWALKDSVTWLVDAVNTSLTRFVLARMDCGNRVYGGHIHSAAQRAAEAVLKLVP